MFFFLSFHERGTNNFSESPRENKPEGLDGLISTRNLQTLVIIFGNDFVGGDLEEEDESFARMVGDRRFLILGEETAMLDNESQYHSQLIQSKLK